jgi:hypothetical protein
MAVPSKLQAARTERALKYVHIPSMAVHSKLNGN